MLQEERRRVQPRRRKKKSEEGLNDDGRRVAPRCFVSHVPTLSVSLSLNSLAPFQPLTNLCSTTSLYTYSLLVPPSFSPIHTLASPL